MGVTFIYFVIIKLQMNALSLALQFITVLKEPTKYVLDNHRWGVIPHKYHNVIDKALLANHIP